MRQRIQRASRSALVLSVAALAFLVMTSVALAVTGELTQLPGTAGCVSHFGSNGECANGKSLGGVNSVAVTADGKSLYAAVSGTTSGDFAVSVFRRDSTTGALTQLSGTAGCVSESGSEGICADGKALQNPRSVAVSPDSKNVYVASPGNFGSGNTVAVFARNPTTGALTQLAGTAGCVSETGAGGQCSDAKALDGAVSVAVSPDGKNAYVASSETGGIAEFARDPSTGELTQLGGGASCISEGGKGRCRKGKALASAEYVTVSSDGKSVYVASDGTASDPPQERGAVAIFRRNATTGALFQPPAGCVSEGGSGGACADGKALAGANSLAVSGDGQRIYVATTNSTVAVFRRTPTTSALTQLVGSDGKAGCISETGAGGQCRDVKAILFANSVAVSGDSQNVYVSSNGIIDEDDRGERGAVAAFKRSALGGLAQLPGTAGCVSETGSAGQCVDGRGLIDANSVAVSGDGKNVYVTSGGISSFASDAIAVFARETPP